LAASSIVQFIQRRSWAHVLFVELAVLFISSTASSIEGDDDGQCLLQTHAEIKFRPNHSPLPFNPLEGSDKKPEVEENAEAINVVGSLKNIYESEASAQDPQSGVAQYSEPQHMKALDHHDSQARKQLLQNAAKVSQDQYQASLPGYSLISVAKESHVISSLLEVAARNSAADPSEQGFFVIGLIVTVVAVIGTLAVCMSMDNSKDTYPAQRKNPGLSHPLPPPSRNSSRDLERRGPTSVEGSVGTLQRELRAGQSPVSTGASSYTSPMMRTHEADLARHSIPSDEEPLCSALVVSHGQAAYLLPDLGQMTRPVEAFDVLNLNGTAVLGVVVNDGSEDPGILLHAPRTADGAGLPLAFVGTSRALQHGGTLPIARPCADKKHGESFAALSCDFPGGYSVRKNGRPIMRFEGDLVGRSIWMYDKTTSQVVGSTQPCRQASDQSRFELHISSGKDAGLAILCLLAISRLENARATIQSSSQGSGQSLQVGPDAGVQGGAHGSLFSYGALTKM